MFVMGVDKDRGGILSPMKLRFIAILAISLATAHADTFDSGAFTMDFVTIGNPGNAADTTGAPNPVGSVGYTYRVGVHEVSRCMIDIYNTQSGGPMLTMSDMTSFGGNGANRPATGVSWNEAARFVNWLNSSSGHSEAYKFTTGGYNDDIALWDPLDAGYDAANPFRNSNAYYFLPSIDEWYKAAYYDPSVNEGMGGYWNYATGSDSAPVTTSGGTAAGTVVYDDQLNPIPLGPADITNAGGLSPYGTMGQNGNVSEWGESGTTPPNDSVDEPRGFRGGSWSSPFLVLRSDQPLSGVSPAGGAVDSKGFRVASIPEPATGLLLVLGAGLAAVARCRRRRQSRNG